MGEVRIAFIANLAASAGMMALGWIPASFALMVSSVFVFSAGQHVYMPLGNAIGMGFAEKGREGSVLGRIFAVNTVALVAGTLAPPRPAEVRRACPTAPPSPRPPSSTSPRPSPCSR